MTVDARPQPALSDTGWAGLYRGLPSGFELEPGERQTLERLGGARSATYGELDPESVERVLGWLRPGPADVLVDLGSGAGRLLVQAVATTAVGRAVGIELSLSRHRIATTVQARLDELAPTLGRRLMLHHGDLRQIDWRDATCVWAGATCFPDPVQRAVVRGAAAAPRLFRLLSTCRLPAVAALQEIGALDLSTTWSHRVRTFVYAPAGRQPKMP